MGVFSASTLQAVGVLLGFIRRDAVVLPLENVVGAGGFEVIVAPVCSGVDGLGLVLVFQMLWISLARSRVRVYRAVLLLPAGIVAGLVANVLRITALVLLGASGHADVAFGAFHSKLGWIVAITLATVTAAEHVPWFRRPGDSPVRDVDGVPA